MSVQDPAPVGKVWAIGAEFDTAAQVFHAAEKCRDAGFTRWDVHTPFPVHGMDEAMGLGRSRLSFFSLVGGCLGLTTAFFLIFLTSAKFSWPEWVPAFVKQNYPLIAHGKPFFALEPSVPIFFELTILMTAFFTVGALLVMNMLPRWHHPVFNWDRMARATDDKFFIVVEAADPKFTESETAQFLTEIGGHHVTVIRDEED
jgi:hypothetical protein